MDKYILGNMVTEKLKREIGIVAKPFPNELKTLETVLPSGSVRFECALYQADKLKKISINKHSHGEGGAGTVVIIAAEDAYDLPFIVVDMAFDFGGKGKIFAEFEAKPLIKDEESTRKYVDPFRKWREELGKLPAESPAVFGEPGEFLKANISPIEYVHLIPDAYADEIVKFADQFFDIYLDIYRKAEPVKDPEIRNKLDFFRSEYNKHALDEDPSGVMLINAFGRQKAELFYDKFINM